MGKRKAGKRDGVVYSSRHGEMCPGCDRPVRECACKAAEPVPASGGTVHVGRETKGRRGKGVTVVRGVPLAGAELAALAKRLKRRCGSGGTVKDGVIEIQGDHRDAIALALSESGYSVKRSGG